MISIGGILVSKGDGGVYGERMLGEFRVWDPSRSKLAALWYLDNSVDLPMHAIVLYLGAAHGTTVSHVADYVEAVYAVEFASRPMKDLLMVARKRKNIVPIFGDATQPQRYAPLLETMDIVYQDVAQPNQATIAIRHIPFLRAKGLMFLMLKTRSVDVRKHPEEVFTDTCADLETVGLRVVKSVWLSPYHEDHVAIICEKT
ncbi:MAG TPA: fibrillarin-like rRNA/tRNA 2'-O-methyltransferase [Methanocorpusculum sp.]|nr:fibrillarin-like rRNA/tRNA 2'-O-methyltransferase [Methanocorpusculum sp.]HJK00992.1 fibrillarin-like rRNA/tRNA 2'-O-methyltransferase [Methanocorpusculum sp.]